MSNESASPPARQMLSIGDYSPASLAGLVLLIGVTLLLHYQPGLGETLGYQRSGFHGGQWPALLTAAGHSLVHINLQHVIVNLAALLCIYLLFSEAFGSLWWLLALFSSAVVSAYGLYFYSPQTDWCIGMSGALHGLFIYAVLRARASWLWLVAIVGKLVIEQQQWSMLEPLASTSQRFIGYDVVVDAHLWGAAGGLLIYAIMRSVAMLMVLREIASSPDRQE